MCYHLYKNQKKQKKISLAKWIFACYFYWSGKLSTATFFLFLPKKIIFSSFPSSLKFFFISFAFPFFAPHNNSREWRESKGKKSFSAFCGSWIQLSFVLLSHALKWKFMQTLREASLDCWREKKERKTFPCFKCKKGMLNEEKNSLPKLKWNWGRFLRVNLLNKITTIYNIFEGFFFSIQSFDMF